MNRTCFVIMPFSGEFDGIWSTVIRKTVVALSDVCRRADDIFAPGVIIKDILQAIRKADYIIADLSQPNPNVYYEMGFAHALRKPVILITRNLESLPFDLRHQRVIIYQDSAQGAEALRDALKKYISQI
jgi:hypothetical protein